MRIFLVSSVLAISWIACAQTSGQPSGTNEPSRKTYSSPDQSFQFTYPSLLIQCGKTQNGGAWEPKECVAYFPTCDEGIGLDEKNTLVCFAYPRNKHTNTSTFEAATFSVAEVNAAVDETRCISPPLDRVDSRKGTVTIQGVRYAHYETGEGGMSQSVGAQVYRTFHGAKCYQLTITTATASAAAFDPPERDLSKRDWAAVNRALGKARDSFQFLK